jgi:excinuclease ABC subunit A
MNPREIIIENAFENNLKNVSLRIPHYQLVVVTGVSGSGKSSLIDDVLGKEGRRLFLENFAGSHFHQSIKLSRPDSSSIQGLFPVVFVSQNNVVRSPRSTVGTLTELYDYLRLLFARMGTSPDKELPINRSLFSPNMPAGYCPVCNGLGIEDHIDPDLIIGDSSKTLREGALTLTTPNGYIIYSQVTLDVLDEVCRSEGFNVDIPWHELTAEQQRIVLYGSDKIKILFGKHTLESRLRWTGITAKPREEGYYKGIIPIMEEILKRDRNVNIMRFTRSFTCPACKGRKLNEKALSVTLWGKNICHYSAMSIRSLNDFFSSVELNTHETAVVKPIRDAILRRANLLLKLGLGYLPCDRESVSLRGGEGQRIKLAVQAASDLRNVLYILDEPSAGLHPSEQKQLLDVLRTLVNSGNTVIAVDHDEQTIRNADWIVDIGPGAGKAGGEILFNGKVPDFLQNPLPASITLQYSTGGEQK